MNRSLYISAFYPVSCNIESVVLIYTFSGLTSALALSPNEKLRK